MVCSSLADGYTLRIRKEKEQREFSAYEGIVMELFDVCNEQGEPTGETVSREIAHRDGILHRTSHVWILREKAGKKQVLLQKRSKQKDSYPGLYDTSSAGHIPAGEEPLPSALRELEEELGIRASVDQLTYAGNFRIEYVETFHDRTFHDNEFTHVYVYWEPVDIRNLIFQKTEVDDADWFDLEEVWNEIQHSKERFCVSPEGMQVLRNYLSSDNDK